MPSTKLEPLRPVGNLEHWCTARHNTGSLHNVGVSCTYNTVAVENFLRCVYSAINDVVRQHPILSAISVDENSGPRFWRLPCIDLERIVQRSYRTKPYHGIGRDQELEDLLEAKLNIPFTNDGFLPYWRIYVLTSGSVPREMTISFIYSHGLADGMSGIIFHEALFSALRKECTPLSNLKIITPTVSLLPNLERIHDLPTSGNSKLNWTPDLWCGNVMKSPVIGRFRTSVFSPSLTACLAQLCRAKKSTVTSTVQEIVAASMFQSIPVQYTFLRGSTQIDIRRFLPQVINRHSMGVFIDQVSQTYHRDDTLKFSWSDAEAIRGKMIHHLADNGKYLTAASLKHDLDLETTMVDMLGEKRPYSFDVSNLGHVGQRMEVAGQGSDWTSSRMVFSQSAAVSSAALGCTMITGADGCLVLGYTWQDGIVEDGIIKDIIEKVEEQLRKLIE